jgi:hypothetical protein
VTCVRVLPAVLLVTLAAAANASAGTVDLALGTLSYSGDAGADNVVTVERPSATTITLKDTAAGVTISVSPNAADASMGHCILSGDTVTCDGPLINGRASIRGNDGDDHLTFGAGVLGGDQYGDDGKDTLQGGPGPDELFGSNGDDTIDGGGGNDTIYGSDGANLLDGEDGDDEIFMQGADTIRDTGTTGTLDTLHAELLVGGATITVDNGMADDGATGSGGGQVQAGFERILGGDERDFLTGSSAAEELSGGKSNDVLTGNGGADKLTGGDADDTLNLVDRAADLDSACGAGTDTANVDDVDPIDADCETRNVTASTGGGGGGTGIKVTGTGSSARTSTVPKVVGKDIAKARVALDAAIPNVNLALNFNRKCAGGKTMDVIKQNPPAGRRITTSEGSVAQIALDVCVPDRLFLADCDRTDLAKDLEQLPDNGDAGLGTELLLRLAKCKTDVDIKLAPKTPEPKVSFDDLARRRGNGAIEATMRCSRNQQDFAVALGEGQQVGDQGDANFSLGEKDGQWVLPGDERALKSLVEIQVVQRTGLLPQAEVYVDADDVKPSQMRPGQAFLTDKGGHASLFIRPTTPGKIRICVVQRVREEGLATWAAEIAVVRGPKTGKTWKTINGRYLQLTGQGNGKLVDAPKARAAGLAEIWQAIVDVFSGVSRTINKLAAQTGSVSLKPPKAFKTAKVGIGQVTLNGRLSAGARPPQLVSGSCLSISGSSVVASRCPTLKAMDGHALMGLSSDGSPLIAGGAGNVVIKAVDPKDAGKTLIGNDGGTFISEHGGALVGDNGASLIGNDGGTLVGDNGASLIPKGSPAVPVTGAGPVTAAMDPNAISIAPNQLIGNDGGTLIGNDGSTLISENGLG